MSYQTASLAFKVYLSQAPYLLWCFFAPYFAHVLVLLFVCLTGESWYGLSIPLTLHTTKNSELVLIQKEITKIVCV